jgi:hypothetical protein
MASMPPSRNRSRTSSRTRAKTKVIPWLCNSLIVFSTASQALVSMKFTESASSSTCFARGRLAASQPLDRRRSDRYSQRTGRRRRAKSVTVRASSRHRVSSNGSPRSTTCSIGSSPARSCPVNPTCSVRGPRHVVTHRWRRDLRAAANRFAQVLVSNRLLAGGRRIRTVGPPYLSRRPIFTSYHRCEAPLLDRRVTNVRLLVFESNFPVDKGSCGYAAL